MGHIRPPGLNFGPRLAPAGGCSATATRAIGAPRDKWLARGALNTRGKQSEFGTNRIESSVYANGELEMTLIATPLATTDSHEMCLTRWQMRPPPTSEVLGLPIMNPLLSPTKPSIPQITNRFQILSTRLAATYSQHGAPTRVHPLSWTQT